MISEKNNAVLCLCSLRSCWWVHPSFTDIRTQLLHSIMHQWPAGALPALQRQVRDVEVPLIYWTVTRFLSSMVLNWTKNQLCKLCYVSWSNKLPSLAIHIAIHTNVPLIHIFFYQFCFWRDPGLTQIMWLLRRDVTVSCTSRIGSHQSCHKVAWASHKGACHRPDFTLAKTPVS